MRKALFFVSLIFLLSSVTAFPTTLEVDKRGASPEDPAQFQLQVTNNHSEPQSFRADPQGPNLRWFHTDGPIRLQPGQSGTINISIDPSSNSFQHNWEFSLRIWMTATNNFETVSSYYRVERRSELEVLSSNLQKQSVKPGNQNNLTITIRNLGSEMLENYRIQTHYMNHTIEKTGPTILAGTEQRPPGQRTFTFNLKTEKDDRPGTRIAQTRIIHQDEVKEEINYTFNVEEVQNVTYSNNTDRSLLSMQKTLSAENKGNTETQIEFTEKIPAYLVPVTAYDHTPNTTENENSQTYYTWTRTLEPGQKMDVSYRINYWIPFAVLILISSGILGLQKLRRSVSFIKQAKIEGENIKVRLILENRSDTVFEDITISDFVQNIADVSGEFEMAKPALKKTDEGTELEWNIDKLRPGEQRIMEYVITPKVEVEGGVTLQPAELTDGEETVSTTDEIDTEFRSE